MRYWQWFILAGFFVPGLPIVSIFLSPSRLFSECLSSSHDFMWHFTILLFFEIGSILWILPQKRFLHGGIFRQFCETLPLSFVTKFGISAFLLLIVDILLFIPVLIGLCMISFTSPLTLILSAAKALIFTLVIIFIQTGFLENFLFIIIGGFLSNIPLSISCMSKNKSIEILTILLSILFLYLFFSYEVYHLKRKVKIKMKKDPIYLITFLKIKQKTPLILRIQFDILTEQTIFSIFCYFSTMGISCGTYALIKAFDYDKRSLIAVITGMIINALIFNKNYYMLSEAHSKVQILLASLPISKRFWLVRDITLVLGFSILPLFAISLPILLHGLISLPMLVSLLCSYFVLLIFLRLTVTINVRFRLMASIMLAGTWATLAIMGIV